MFTIMHKAREKKGVHKRMICCRQLATYAHFGMMNKTIDEMIDKKTGGYEQLSINSCASHFS